MRFGQRVEVADGDRGSVVDARVVDVSVAIAGLTLTALAGFAPAGVIGAQVEGPLWLRVLLPVLLGAPLMLRRRAPLLMWIAIWAVIAVQYAITRHPPQGLEWFVPFAAAYSLGAHASRRWAGAGLAVPIVMLLIARPGLSLIPVVAIWLVGVFVRTRRRASALEGHNASLARQAEQAAADERARIARELHDIIAHHLSVIVLQAAGAQAARKTPDTTLAKIENSARQALTETRRLLDVLRDPAEDTGLAPQPGIEELDTLATSVRAAGLPVTLTISGDRTAVPAAVNVSVYRIVQEALTNVARHAGHARADVTVACADAAVTVEITDTGITPARGASTGGHGLAGMRERAAIFGGELRAGPRPGGGYAVQARLPLDGDLPARERTS